MIDKGLKDKQANKVYCILFQHQFYIITIRVNMGYLISMCFSQLALVPEFFNDENWQQSASLDNTEGLFIKFARNLL